MSGDWMKEFKRSAGEKIKSPNISTATENLTRSIKESFRTGWYFALSPFVFFLSLYRSPRVFFFHYFFEPFRINQADCPESTIVALITLKEIGFPFDQVHWPANCEIPEILIFFSHSFSQSLSLSLSLCFFVSHIFHSFTHVNLVGQTIPSFAGLFTFLASFHRKISSILSSRSPFPKCCWLKRVRNEFRERFGESLKVFSFLWSEFTFSTRVQKSN